MSLICTLIYITLFCYLIKINIIADSFLGVSINSCCRFIKHINNLYSFLPACVYTYVYPCRQHVANAIQITYILQRAEQLLYAWCLSLQYIFNHSYKGKLMHTSVNSISLHHTQPQYSHCIAHNTQHTLLLVYKSI